MSFSPKDKPFLLLLSSLFITLCFACIGGIFACLFENSSFESISIMILAVSCFSIYIVFALVLSTICLIHYRSIIKNEKNKK